MIYFTLTRRTEVQHPTDNLSSDPLLEEAISIVRKEGKASTSMIQRRLRIGYTRATRIIDTMEDMGIVGPPEGAAQMRKILGMSQKELEEMEESNE